MQAATHAALADAYVYQLACSAAFPLGIDDIGDGHCDADARDQERDGEGEEGCDFHEALQLRLEFPLYDASHHL